MKIAKILAVLFAVLVILSACSLDDENGILGGILVNEDVLSSIKQEALDKENSMLAADGDVFWSASGTIWHATYECSFLANSKTVYHGSVDEARLEGKERECSRCFLTEEDKLYAALEGNPISEGDVFFTKEGELWHTDINCSSLLGADRIYNADTDKAKELGKSGVCDKSNK